MLKNKTIKILGLFSLAALVYLMPDAAQAFGRAFQNPISESGASLGVSEIVGRIVLIALTMAGVLATVFIMLGGIKLITGYIQGSEEKVAQGKKAVLFAIVGLVVAFGGYVIINVILQNTGFLISGEKPAVIGPGNEMLSPDDPRVPK